MLTFRSRFPSSKQLQVLEDSSSQALSDAGVSELNNYWQKVRRGEFRYCVPSSTLTCVNPEEQDMEAKIFNIASSINIYSGLLVSGLIGYVLSPQDILELERTDGITGLPRQTLADLQILLSHINLVTSCMIFSTTVFVMVCVSQESRHTILYTASRASTLGTWAFIGAIQASLVSAQACLAALLSMSATWAWVAVVVDVLLTVGFFTWIQLALFDMFPVQMDSWAWAAPAVLLKQLIYGRGTQRRLGRVMSAQAADHINLEDFREPFEEDEDEKAESDELWEFLQGALPEVDEYRLAMIHRAMMDEALTVERLRRAAAQPEDRLSLLEWLDMGKITIKKGERLDILEAAIIGAKS